MSGIVGLLNTNEAPVDETLLRELTALLRFRGPDAERVWVGGHAGFGHTLLATTDEAAGEHQPCTLDGHTWIVADARIDDRETLKGALASAGRAHARDANDAELILHAYAAWGEGSVDHLIGDFAFAIWDRGARTLFCARDHFGAKPFFYAHQGSALVFSNTLAAVRRHPSVSDTIDERTIGDYLLFRYNLRPAATGFADVNRLAPGHALTWKPGTPPTVRQYWTLSMPAEIRYGRASDYVDHFRHLFEAAVRDRLRTRRVVVSMSGGMDSTSIAAEAKRLFTADGTPFDLRAHTVVFDHVIPDEERRYAGLAASALDIPIQFLVADDYNPYEAAAGLDVPVFAEPTDIRFSRLYQDFWAGLAADARVVLSGDDADGVLNERWTVYFRALLGARRPTTLLNELAIDTWWNRRFPRLGLRTALKRWMHGDRPPVRQLPAWLDSAFAARCDLKSRLKKLSEAKRGPLPMRPRMFEDSSVWWRSFENMDAAITGHPFECRWPYADRRLIDYLLAIPTAPWCIGKVMLREATKGLLPEAVRLRRKTPLPGDAVLEALRKPEAAWLDTLEPPAALSRYVDRRRLPKLTGEAASAQTYFDMCPVLLGWWLQRTERAVLP